MKELIRRLSRVADSSSQYSLLRTDSQSQHAAAPRLSRRLLVTSKLRRRRRRSSSSEAVPPQGHVPVYVGIEELERFVVSAELLNHPIFVGLLNKSAQEYGYEQKGVLRIPCHVILFERVLHALKVGHFESRDLQELLNSLTEEFL